MAEYGAARVRDKLVWQHSVAPLLAAYDRLFAQRDAVLAAKPGSSPKALRSAPDPDQCEPAGIGQEPDPARLLSQDRITSPVQAADDTGPRSAFASTSS